MMQLLCLVAMEPPGRPLGRRRPQREGQGPPGPARTGRPRTSHSNVVRAQYTAGSIEGEEVPGYLQEKGVEPDSTTEHLRRHAADAEQLAVGRRAVLPPDRQAAAQARHRDRHPVPPAADGALRGRGRRAGGANLLVLRIQPNEGASLAFQAKIPGSRRRLQEVRMDFRYGTAFAVPPPEAYERLLLDVMLGDPTLFTRTDEVESAWRFITHDPRRLAAARRPPPGHLRRRHLGPRGGRRAAQGRRGHSGGGYNMQDTRSGKAAPHRWTSCFMSAAGETVLIRSRDGLTFVLEAVDAFEREVAEFASSAKFMSFLEQRSRDRQHLS